ncbi:Asp-tRNA(Asn)/Glu-tRNA(Gln) amidotransferase subunit GatC [Actinotignum sp. GS-2025f]|uniref:Asp-tRNA(Asn)/Glu-tRNA(Gln) amidotransferase subunit GatC n=1 Tax=Actinotignum TaxID=1653174 RepID=UPI0025503256|nr:MULTISPECIES: Asp-tRNA(Asn)/Glu-tRNA(Gln) amidotransferase subunit GatC [Actinotignum]MDK8286719.1 Asp-tRNA(Asn)/Glu-tRNA(Gln) amidotransferase subunit GatC [Actinotignum sanguinis]MDK8353681.1 Asp-tRNA(Asn)/Glu-tRNA(Gln) amidotransferase subunit GatC [Actinotignum sanguinis]MDK8651556.1 Asp-tRNA(Asn)/Glu-tRNA(Gln) amidotransferase subunit GatC [Actinotignum sanguinis]MDK8802019.1 Asp-tRNA(Asn)/Glu-tRNA(Gln) amidotransferase subunit GatC [Actinotignum sanguinis]MDY5127856.1 Asp-tRNA(Asn)/Gl
MSSFSKEEVARLADLSRIALTDTEAEKMAGELSVIEDAVKAVSEVVTPDIPFTYNPLPLANVKRPDVPGETLDREEVLAAAPAAEEGKFLVPRIMGEE